VKEVVMSRKNTGLWTLVLTLGVVALASACSAIDDNDKTNNPKIGSGGTGATNDAGPGPTGGLGPTGGVGAFPTGGVGP
jgi:hypothetical protein